MAGSSPNAVVGAPREGGACILVGPESAGKSTLAAALTGARAEAGNFRGTTIAVERYGGPTGTVIDTPGLTLAGDSEAVSRTVAALDGEEAALAVVRASSLDEDLRRVLPLLAGRRGGVVVTHRDRLPEVPPAALAKLRRDLGVPTAFVDARRLGAKGRADVGRLVGSPGVFGATAPPPQGSRWVARQRRGPLEHPAVLAAFAIALLLLPAVGAVWVANHLAGLLEPDLDGALAPLLATLAGLPSPLGDLLAGPYGIVAMGPFLLLWALPTVILYALLLGALKSSGALELITAGLHPLVRPLGLSGRDLAPFVMGYGCNVPAVVRTRSCSACTRPQAVGAIAFGSACSYQLGASAAVFGARGLGWLVAPFLGFLLATTAIYARATRPRGAAARIALDLHGPERAFVCLPRPAAVWREASATVRQFASRALPIFAAICVIASLLSAAGALAAVGSLLGPLMAAFGLPAEAGLGVVLASVRKDGIMLFASPDLAASLAPLQLLTAVYLAGVLLPCLVTTLTIGRELSAGFALRLLARQAAFACAFALCLAWGGRLLEGLG